MTRPTACETTARERVAVDMIREWCVNLKRLRKAPDGLTDHERLREVLKKYNRLGGAK